MGIFSKKKSVLFDFVLDRTKQLNESFSNEVHPKLSQNKFMRIIEGDKNSPLIMGLGENKHLIYYPKNSTPYLHRYETSIKFVEVLSGEIYDELTGRKFVKDDQFKIYPEDQIKPYTKDRECYVKVCVSEVDSIWERVCD